MHHTINNSLGQFHADVEKLKFVQVAFRWAQRYAGNGKMQGY